MYHGKIDGILTALTSLVNRIRAAIPGNTRVKNGKSFKNAAKTVPPLACEMFLAAKRR